MTKLRLIISNYDDLKNPYYAGGGASAVHAVATRLTNDFDITVITSKYPRSFDQVIDGILYRRIGLSFVGPYLGQILFQLLLPFHVLMGNFDVWLETFGPPFTASFLPVFTKKPVIGLVHMLPAIDMQRKYKFPFLPRLVEILALKLYTKFIVLSAKTRQEILTYNPQAQIFIIPNGVTIPNRLPILTPQHILYMGRIEINQKGLDLLLYAYKLLLPHNPPPLVIAGSGSPSQIAKLQGLISHLNLDQYVTFAGRVSGQVRDRLFRAAHVVVVPSRFESFSLTALETLSYGKPLVCFDIPGLSWVPLFCSFKADNLTPLALSQALSASLDPVKSHKLSANSRPFARRFNWANIAASYLQAIHHAYADSIVTWSTSLHPNI
jgi:glycosyltransferase involved in cell wall biosynthesis